MKNLLVLFVLVSLFSCKGVEQYKASIDELSGKWDAATSAVTEVSKMVTDEQASISNMLTGMAIAPEVMAKLKAEDQEKLNTGLQTCTSAAAGYSSIATEISSFVADWTSKGEMLNTLKAGFDAGKIEGDVPAQVTELSTFAADAMTKVDGWKNAFAGVKKSCDDNMATYKTLMDSLIPAIK